MNKPIQLLILLKNLTVSIIHHQYESLWLLETIIIKIVRHPQQLIKNNEKVYQKLFLIIKIPFIEDSSNVSLSQTTNHTQVNFPSIVHYEQSTTECEIEKIPYDSSLSALISSSSSSSVSQNSTSTTTSSSDENQTYETSPSDDQNRDEKIYTVETFYRSSNNSSDNQQVIVVRENSTEEQFNLAQEKQHQTKYLQQLTSSQNTLTTIETNVVPLTALFDAHHQLTVKQTTPTPSIIKKEKIYEK